MAIFNKLTKISQDMVRGTKDFTDTARLRSLIADEQKQIAALYAQIGKLCCEASEYDTETPMGKLCIAVEAANQRIAKHTDEIRKIKGTRRCANCGVCGEK